MSMIRPGLYLTECGLLAKIVRLASRKACWLLVGAIYDPKFKIWCLNEWAIDGSHNADPGLAIRKAIE